VGSRSRCWLCVNQKARKCLRLPRIIGWCCDSFMWLFSTQLLKIKSCREFEVFFNASSAYSPKSEYRFSTTSNGNRLVECLPIIKRYCQAFGGLKVGLMVVQRLTAVFSNWDGFCDTITGRDERRLEFGKTMVGPTVRLLFSPHTIPLLVAFQHCTLYTFKNSLNH